MRGHPNPLARNSAVPQRLLYETQYLSSFLEFLQRWGKLMRQIGALSLHCQVSTLTCFFFSPQAEVTSPTDSEDRTPGRLQAVWPPPKTKDEEEKVGLKYTEAGKNCNRCLSSHLKTRTLMETSHQSSIFK